MLQTIKRIPAERLSPIVSYVIANCSGAKGGVISTSRDTGRGLGMNTPLEPYACADIPFPVISTPLDESHNPTTYLTTKTSFDLVSRLPALRRPLLSSASLHTACSMSVVNDPNVRSGSTALRTSLPSSSSSPSPSMTSSSSKMRPSTVCKRLLPYSTPSAIRGGSSRPPSSCS